MRTRCQDAMQFFQKLDDLKAEEREKELHAYRQKAQEKLAAFLKVSLKEDQCRRLRQLELQQEGLFALLRQRGDREGPEDHRRATDSNSWLSSRRCKRRSSRLLNDAQNGGDPEEIRPKVMKIRKEHEGRIEALLTDAQKKQWKEMLGKPLDLGD